MQLTHLSDEFLASEMVRVVGDERTSTSIVLHHLREVDRRRLYSKLNYKSLFDYAVKFLKYSEDQAWRRISAMQLLKEIPQIEEKINDGALSLSTLSLAKKIFAQEAKCDSPVVRTSDEKLEVLQKLENVSRREAEKILIKETGMTVKPVESVRQLNGEDSMVKIVLQSETIQDIETIKGWLAHSHPGIMNSELIALAVNTLRAQLNPATKAERARKIESKIAAATPKTAPAQKHRVTHRTRYIPATVRHEVWLRDGGKCTNCSSTYAVQYEHIIPFAKGGYSTAKNIKLLCRNCNQRSAIQQYGHKTMSKFLREPFILYR
jgi:hypothetical protein